MSYGIINTDGLKQKQPQFNPTANEEKLLLRIRSLYESAVVQVEVKEGQPVAIIAVIESKREELG